MPKSQSPAKFNLGIKILLICFILCLSQFSYAQEDCNCKSGEKITVCYYSTQKFCPPDGECRYTLDGWFMVNSLNSKLQNPDLFGPQGISKCPIVLEVVEDIATVEYLEEKECNIMFVGVFTDFVNGAFLPTSIPQSELAIIKEWSTKCPSNLTIISQIEAAPWGYEFEDLNENPNRPDPAFTEFSIFNGSFGKISKFNQGGSFQGIFTAYPTSGYSILARDLNNEPTIVLDSLTNDIILGDIGILCNTAGPLSISPIIKNDSDILACNLFDLGCKIATNSTTEFIDICEGENYVTNSGQILYDEGVYVDSLLTIEGCDSLIYTLLDVNILHENVYSQIICDDEDYKISVGSNVYSKSNTFGSEILESIDGCDSTVHIELYYFQSDTSYLFESICNNEIFFVGNIPFSETTFEEVVLQNKDLCDSIVYLNLIVHDTYDILTQINLCPGEFYVATDGEIISEEGIYTEFLNSVNGCDSLISVSITAYENYEYSEYYEGCQGDGYSLNIEGTVYDESNSMGTEFLQSLFGCDSIINIEFQYYEADITYLKESICEGEIFLVGGFPFSQTGIVEVMLQNNNLCDSIVYLDLVSNGVYYTQSTIDLCPGEFYVATDGTILTEEVIYTEFLYSEYECDSTNTIIIKSNESYQREESYIGCEGDGYRLSVGENVYDEINPTGIENLQSSKGCDSIVSISFEYQPLDTTYLNVQLCPYENFEVGGVAYSGNIFESIILSSSKNCDSIIMLDLETFESEEIILAPFYDVDLNASFSFGIPELNTSNYEWISDGELSCDTCANPNLLLKNLPTFLQLDYTDKYNCFYTSKAEVNYKCTPFFPNVININSVTEENRHFKIEALCSFENYSLNVFDRWGSLVFATNDQDASWEGRYNGKNLAQGVYLYQMKFILKGQEQQIIGSLTLLH